MWTLPPSSHARRMLGQSVFGNRNTRYNPPPAQHVVGWRARRPRRTVGNHIVLTSAAISEIGLKRARHKDDDIFMTKSVFPRLIGT